MRKKLIAAAIILIMLAAAVAGRMHLNAEPDQPEPEAQPLVIIVYGEGVRESVYNGRIEIENDGSDGNEIRIFVYAGEGGKK